MVSEKYTRMDMSIPENQEWYQKLAVLFRKNCVERGAVWPQVGDAPAVSRYPNLLMELRNSFLPPSALARSAGVQLRTIVGAVELGTKLSPVQMGKLARALNVDVEYLEDPWVAVVDGRTSTGAQQQARVGHLLEETKGLQVPERKRMEAIYNGIPKRGSSFPYASYRYFIHILLSAKRNPLPCGNEPCGKVLYIEGRMAL